MSRPAEGTRADLIEAAVEVFAAKGFEAGSVREIARAAGANLAAVSYHFGGKEGLYREVLKRSVAAFDDAAFDPDIFAALSREEAVRAFLRGQFAALRRRSELARYLRIFAWEDLSQTNVFAEFVATEKLPILEVGAALVARFLPDATEQDRAIALVWLVHQAEPFTRHAERLSAPPVRLKPGAALAERLTEILSTAVIAGLEALAAQPR